ncbi:MAG TPA: glycoside hydrolase family 57 protein [Candidatus Saccharimonadales bacterium]|nr:glycoside hydrolase family 57 protein [Candidatus Saccharimonadales bacterium]
MSKRQITLYLHVHQPYRLGRYTAFDTAERHDYFATEAGDIRQDNEAIFKKVAQKSYWPMNRLLEKLLKDNPDFRLSLSITGTFIEQALEWDPELIKSFQRLTSTGRVEIVAETYHHSLAFFYSRMEFEKQVFMHREMVQRLFNQTPQVFRNTELAYNDELAAWADEAGYKAVLAEGWDKILGWRSPNYVYQPIGTSRLKLLLKNYRLSDDIAFRFSNRAWADWPLTADKYLDWLDQLNDDQQLINLFMDYETFGEHQWADTGIFDFLEDFVSRWLNDGNGFLTTTQAADLPVVDRVSASETVTWADNERDLTAWLGNRMQQEAMKFLYELEDDILRTHDQGLIADWRLMQTSDHSYYMCTKWWSDGDVHSYFSPYDSPYDAFMYFMNALRDLRWRLLEHQKKAVSHGA